MSYRQPTPVHLDPIDAALSPGERVLWKDRARRGIILSDRDGLLIPMGIAMTVIGLAAMGSIVAGAPLHFALVGFVFFAWGVYMGGGRLLVDAQERFGTCYGLTDQRVLIVTPKKVQSFPLGQLQDLTLTERPDGGGTVHLGRPEWRRPTRVPLPGYYSQLHHPPTLELVRHARAVYQAILQGRATRMAAEAATGLPDAPAMQRAS